MNKFIDDPIRVELFSYIEPNEKAKLDLYIETWNQWAETFNQRYHDGADLILPGDYQTVLRHILYQGINQLDSEIKSLNSTIKLNEVIA